MKLLKIIAWILRSRSVLSLLWEIYQASKDGKVTKAEFDNITDGLADVIGDII